MKIAVMVAALAISGCASTELSSVKGSPAVYETRVRGQHAELAGCVADNLQGHEKYVVRSQKYAVRNYTDKSEIQAYQESIYGGNVYVFTVDLHQIGKNSVKVSLRNIEAFKEFVSEAAQSCSSGA